MSKPKEKNLIGKLLLLVLILMLVVSGCGSKEESKSVEYSTEKSEAVEEEAEMASGSSNGQADMDDVALDSSAITTSKKSDDALASQVDSRKYIRTYRYYMETLTFDETVADLDKLVDLHFGFYQSSETSGRAINSSNYQRRAGSYVIRIPKEKVNEFTKGIESIGHILDKTNFVDDVTGQYFDLEARIKTLRVQEERLLAILEEADELEYIIELERELSRVTYEIESYMTSFKELENQINYSTIYINLNEVFEETVIVEKPPTFFEEMKNGFLDSVDVVINFFERLVLFLTTNIPVFILLAIFVFIIFKIVNRLIRPKKLVVKQEIQPKAAIVDIKNKESMTKEDLDKPTK